MKRRMRMLLPMAVAILAGSASMALALDPVFVDASAPGGGDGTSGLPVQTIAAALALVDDGGTINIAAGTYKESLTVTKNVALIGPNAGVSPSLADGSANPARVAEAIIQPIAHNTGTSDWTFNSFAIKTGTGCLTLTVDGLTLDGFNPDLATGSDIIGGNTVDPVGATTGIQAIGAAAPNRTEAVIENNIIKNFSQFPVYIYGDENTVRNNRISNNGVPYVSGYGMAVNSSANAYCTCTDNVTLDNRGGFQFQGHNAASAAPAILANNIIERVESLGIFLNVMSGTANNWTITGNTISGRGFDQGTGAFALISQTDGGTPRRHIITNNNASNIAAGFYFANNTALSQRISGGTITNVLWAMTVVNRLGYNGYMDYSINGGAALRDGNGGPAAYNSAVATAALEAGLTGQLMVPVAPDAVNGQTAFANTDFTGKVALLTVNQGAEDESIASKNAADAGAIAVVLIRNESAQPGIRPVGTAFPSVDIPTTSIDKGDGDALKAALTGGDTIEVTLNSLFFRTNNFGVAAPAMITGSSSGTLVNVQINNPVAGGFAVVNIPNQINPHATNVPGPVAGEVIGGSVITGAPVGVLIDGTNASFETQSARFEGNEIGVHIKGGSLSSVGSAFAHNTVAGIKVEGATATAMIDDSDFFGAAQLIGVDLEGTPSNFVVVNSNFAATNTAIENRSHASGDVVATGNFWGAANGPDDDAGVINGDGARISLGVDAADFVPAAFIVSAPDTTDTDNDGIPDELEEATGTDPNSDTDPADTTDSNGDGIPDSVKTALGLDVMAFDSDGDGIADWYELLRGTDAANEFDFPPFGDVDGNAVVDNVDAIQILEAFLSLRDFQTINRAEADLNQDGVLDNVDAIILFNYFLLNIPYVPFP